MLVSTRTVLLTTMLAATVGCVSSGTHDAMVAERDGLVQHAEGLSGDKAQLEGRIAELDAKLASLESQKTEMASKIDRGSEKMADLSGTYEALVANLESELASGQVEVLQMRDGLHVNVADDVLFASGSALVDPKGQEVLAKVAAQLVATPNPIRVEGHTDDVPISGALSSRYPTNWELAGARAASVVRMLAEEGIDAPRLRAVSSGEFSPRAANDSDEGRALNRRIEIRLLPVVEHADGIASQEPGADTAKTETKSRTETKTRTEAGAGSNAGTASGQGVAAPAGI
jgi:chemotaxis protein MotB